MPNEPRSMRAFARRCRARIGVKYRRLLAIRDLCTLGIRAGVSIYFVGPEEGTLPSGEVE
jgi:hypothetical protein